MRNKLLYRYLDEKFNVKSTAENIIQNILVKATPTSSCWWSKMKSRSDGFRNHIDAIKHKQINHFKTGADVIAEEGATVKTCPGIIDLFKHAYLVKSPTDIVITVSKDGAFYYNVKDPGLVSINSHDSEQYYQDDNPLFRGRIALKFQIHLNIRTTGFTYMLADPIYHSSLGCTVATGLMAGKYVKNQSLNIISFVDIPKDEETRTLTIRAGDVIAYLIPFEKCSLAFSEEDFITTSLMSTFDPKKWLT